jgi:hypothetical protein
MMLFDACYAHGLLTLNEYQVHKMDVNGKKVKLSIWVCRATLLLEMSGAELHGIGHCGAGTI